MGNSQPYIEKVEWDPFRPYMIGRVRDENDEFATAQVLTEDGWRDKSDATNWLAWVDEGSALNFLRGYKLALSLVTVELP